jgi:ADP-ribose pyrophosphatase
MWVPEVVVNSREAYDRLRAERPGMFVNPPGSPIEIVFDADAQEEYGDVGVLYEDAYLKLVKDVVRFPSGRLGTYVRTCAAVDGEGVVMVVTAPDGRIVLVRHFRHGCREWHWELPRGFAEAGLDGPDNATKEIREELGIIPEGVTLLGRLDEQQSDRKVGVYHATAAIPDDLALTDDATEEGIDQVRLFTAYQLRSMIVDGEITDLFTLGAYALMVTKGLLPSGA